MKSGKRRWRFPDVWLVIAEFRNGCGLSYVYTRKDTREAARESVRRARLSRYKSHLKLTVVRYAPSGRAVRP